MLITLDLIKSGSVHTKQRKQETLQEFLKRLTHLHLNGKHITKITSFEECINLEVLYLYDNEIKCIENLDNLTKLSHLYLQDNQIAKISNMDHFSLLQKLSLDRNCISVVEGLHNQVNLEELYVSSQRYDQQDQHDQQQLSFDGRTLETLSRTLTSLHCASNNISSLQDISKLRNLTLLDLSHNNISEFIELQALFTGCVRLQKLSLKGNPICKKRELKDSVIAMSSPALQILDDKEITSNERVFLAKKSAMRKMTPQLSTTPQPSTPQSIPQPQSVFPGSMQSTSNLPSGRRNSTSSIKKSDKIHSGTKNNGGT